MPSRLPARRRRYSAGSEAEVCMAAQSGKAKSLGLSIVIGIVIGTLAAILSSHFAVWLIAGIFVGIAAGASLGRTKCPECEAKQPRATSPEPRA
jgi:hypothetical protein